MDGVRGRKCPNGAVERSLQEPGDLDWQRERGVARLSYVTSCPVARPPGNTLSPSGPGTVISFCSSAVPHRHTMILHILVTFVPQAGATAGDAECAGELRAQGLPGPAHSRCICSSSGEAHGAGEGTMAGCGQGCLVGASQLSVPHSKAWAPLQTRTEGRSGSMPTSGAGLS